jgi:hypothetical protein
MVDEQVSQSRPFRPRISLLSAIMLMTIAGMAIVIAQLWSEVGPLRAELVKLHNETGRLSVDDPTKIHAIEVRTSEPLMWKWRVWVPEGPTVLARYRWGSNPSSGTPPASASLQLKPGENWVTLRAHDKRPNSWSARLETATDYVGTSIREPDRWWQWPTSSSTDSGIGFTTAVVAEGDSTFVLKHYRVSPNRNRGQPLRPTDPTSGFIIWLERR